MGKRVTHGACGKTWNQYGNKSGHCSLCHETYYGITAFDAHQNRIDGNIICFRPTQTGTGNTIEWWQDADGQWHTGKRLTTDEWANIKAIGDR